MTLTLRLRYQLQCGRPAATPIVIALPGALRLPSHVAAATVALDGRPVAGASLDGHSLTVRPAARHGITCDVIGPGTVTLVVGRAAGLGNPVAAGAYPLSARVGALMLRTSLRITKG